MANALTPEATREALARLAAANQRFAAAYPGEPAHRQPVHTVYGGAHLFKADIAAKLGAAALQSLRDYAPDAATFAGALGLGPAARSGATGADSDGRDQDFASAIYRRVEEKLQREAVEDFRIDFEDGYGNRSDAEEDGHATAVAEELARGMRQRSLPPFIGIRIKPLTQELHARALRTLDLVVMGVLEKSGGLPPEFVVTLPKVTSSEQVSVLVDVFELIERQMRLPAGTLRMELMIELPQTLIGASGEILIPSLVAAAHGRCRGAHFGTYDYTAGCNITAAHQVPSHPACDFARHLLQVCLASTGVTLSDGATTVMPVGPHRAAPGGPPLTPAQREENVATVHRGWKVHFDDVRSSLRNAYYQGWDLNPAQLPTRYAAVFSFFLESRDEAAARLKTFVEKAAQATLLGNIFDDAATGQGLLNFFLRGINCGALTEEEALATGLTLEELRGRSFVKILVRRRKTE